MYGEFVAIWPATVPEIWDELASRDDAPADLFVELYREMNGVLLTPLAPGDLADVLDSPDQSREVFQALSPGDLKGERSLVAFLEAAFEVLEDLGGDLLTNHYFNLLEAFIAKYSLRYDLRRPCILCPTLPGVFSSLMRDLRTVTTSDQHLGQLMSDLEESIRDLRAGTTETRIKTSIQKQMNLLEALARACPGVTKTTLGAMCEEVGFWPHDRVKEALQNLYGFASDYPGIRHAGTPANALKSIEMRDMVAISVLLAGFAPYVSHQLDADVMYLGT